MNRMRRWTPGREYTAAISGETWFTETDDTLTIAAVLHGSWGTNQPELVAEFGPWDEDAYQLWTARIPKDASYTVNDLFDPPLNGPEVRHQHWQDAFWELYDKPHRAVRNAIDHGKVVSRTAVNEIPGVRQVSYYGVIRYETPQDARAVRLWQQARLRAEIRQARAVRRWRGYRDAETWHPRSYKGAARKYGCRKRDSR